MADFESAKALADHLLPFDAIHAVQELIASQAVAHSNEDWRALPREDHVAAALRHLGQRGLDLDSGYPHDVHAAARLLMALESRPLGVVRADLTGVVMGDVRARRQELERQVADEDE